MSTRAIGQALGVDHRTVGHDLERGEYSPPDPAPVTGLDGKTYPAREAVEPPPSIQAPPDFWKQRW